MGALLSRWKAKPSTVEVLEKMEKEIQSLEEFQEKNQKLRKIWVGRLLVYSAFLYFLTCLIVYLWYLPDGFTARLLIIIPFLLFPVIIWFARTLLIVWFSKRTERNNEALEDLKVQKKKIEPLLVISKTRAGLKDAQLISLHNVPLKENLSSTLCSP